VKTSKTRIWLCAAGIAVLVALTWLSPVTSVGSQELKPLFDASECAPVLDGYVDDGHSAGRGAIVCKYNKDPAGDPPPGDRPRENWNSLWLIYYPSVEEATAWIRDNYLTDDHLKPYSCETHNDCDRIERALLDRTDSSMYGYTMDLNTDPTNISMQRRFVYKSYGASIFVQGRAFESLDQAKAEVAALEQLAKTLVDAPREMVAEAEPAGTGTPGATAEPASEPTADPNAGKDCREYCKELDFPSSQYVSGETYPDCDCACSGDKVYFGGQCTSCDTVCAGDDKYTLKPQGEECSCLCKDPTQKWDRASGECVAGEDRTGMACAEYCDLVDPGLGWVAPGSGDTYPDCDCWCDPAGGAVTYINGLCVPCQSACTGDDVFLVQSSDGPCRCMCRDHTKTWDQATGQCVAAPDKTGMSCTDYCAQLGPGKATPLTSSGDTYPDCQCQCQEDGSRQYTFFQNQCVPCAEMCRGEGMMPFPQKKADCSCLCIDPQQKWDRASGTCVPLDGTECNGGNGCQPERGENCANCSDCTCTIVSAVDPKLSLSKVCQPQHPKADIRGCVVAEDETSPENQLATQESQWEECRDAWALMNLAKVPTLKGDGAAAMSNLSSLPQIAHWQRQCNCIPVGGVVLGNEAADPMICLIRCCDRLQDGIDSQEERIKDIIPVIRGPGIKTRPAGAEVEILEGQTVKIDGSLDLWGDRPNPLITTFGTGSPRSEYEVVHRPESGMEVYLYEGTYTHTYYDEAEGVVKQEEITTGEMLSIGPDGAPVSRSAFDPASRESCARGLRAPRSLGAWRAAWSGRRGRHRPAAFGRGNRYASAALRGRGWRRSRHGCACHNPCGSPLPDPVGAGGAHNRHPAQTVGIRPVEAACTEGTRAGLQCGHPVCCDSQRLLRVDVESLGRFKPIKQ
jgi:hypothetical protein